MANKKQLLTKEEIIDKLSAEKEYLTKHYNITEIGLFGSYLRGEQTKKSDIDILISFMKSPDFFTFLEIEEYLSSLFKTKVDLVTKNSLKPFIGSIIKKEVVFV